MMLRCKWGLLLLAFCLEHTYIACGTRIIGGDFAKPGQFPYTISLQYKGRHQCGGSLISDKVVVTAAHCTIGLNPADLRVIAGTVDLLANDGKSCEIEKIQEHPQYNAQVHDYDISLITLKEPVPLGGNINTIELVSEYENHAADTLATISGYGAVNSNLELPNRLKYASVQLWSRDYCNPENVPGVTDRMICAGHPSGQVGSCQGDSGGPLTVADKLFGLVSWGFGCGVRGRPVMYTYLGAFRSWIKETSGV